MWLSLKFQEAKKSDLYKILKLMYYISDIGPEGIKLSLPDGESFKGFHWRMGTKPQISKYLFYYSRVP
jgi:hypothetical protein